MALKTHPGYPLHSCQTPQNNKTQTTGLMQGERKRYHTTSTNSHDNMEKKIRNNFFIKKNFQGKLILGYVLFVLCGCLLFLLLLTFFSAEPLTINCPDHNPVPAKTLLLLLRNLITTHWLTITAGIIVLVAVAMRVTHRIAGPLYRFEKTLDNMLARNLDDTIRLRKRDEGKELANKINVFNTDTSRTIKTLQKHSEALEDIIDKARIQLETLPQEKQEELRWLFWSMDDQNRKIRAVCKSYTLRNDA